MARPSIATFFVLQMTMSWKTSYVVCDKGGTSSAVAYAGSAALVAKLKATPGTTTYYSVVDTSKNDTFDRIFDDIRRVARVVSFWGHSIVLRRFLIEAAQRNMTNGEYTSLFIVDVIHVDGFSYNTRPETIQLFFQRVYLFFAPFEYPTPLYGNVTWQNDDKFDQIAFDAYRSLLLVIPTPEGKAAERFRLSMVPELKRRSLEGFNYVYHPGELPTPIVYSDYACFYMLGKVLNETLANSTKDLSESGFLAQKFWNAEFDTPDGHYSFDEVGERRIRLDIQQLNETSGLLTAVFRNDPYTFKIKPLRPLRWWTGGDVPLDVPVCGFLGVTGPCAVSLEASRRNATNIVVGVVVGAFLVIFFGTFVTRYLVTEAQLSAVLWRIHVIVMPKPDPLLSLATTFLSPPHYTSVYQDRPVLLIAFPCSVPVEAKPNRRFLVIAKELLNGFHPNLARFYGVARTEGCAYFAFEQCQRGDLHQFLVKPPLALDRDLKLGWILDLLQGMKAVDGMSTLRCHGLLNCSTCAINSHFTLKLTDTAAQKMLKAGFAPAVPATCFDNALPSTLLHLAPEVSVAKNMEASTSASDVFSFGTLCAEIISEGAAHKQEGDLLEDKSGRQPSLNYSIISQTRFHVSQRPGRNILVLADLPGYDAFRSKKGPLGSFPKISPSPGFDSQFEEMAPKKNAAALVRRCWSANPADRPSLKEILSSFQRKGGQISVAQKVIDRLSRYADDLEHAVGLRTQALLLERQKCDQILSHMLPVSVVEKLRKSQTVEPETFDLVTMQFSDIVGFMTFVQFSIPLKVVDFLNKAHGLFDNVISVYDVYKVETIGDSYFVASGLPRRNGENHISEICRTAKRMQNAFLAAQLGNGQMEIRIGIHSGPCVAAVAGLQRPRYCLFGDTVNTTSRMETHGEASKIHLSGVAAGLIKDSPDFECISRGEVEIKGKGKMNTYWLSWNVDQ